MKILCCLLHFGYYRNFESVIRELARRGHRVHVAAERGGDDRAREHVDALAREYPAITVGTLPPREPDGFSELAQRLRLGYDYLRYLEPAYRGMPGLRMRSEDRVPVGLLRVLSLPGMRTLPARRFLRTALRGLERAIPPSTRIERYLLDERPDAVLITPLIGVAVSSQADYLATAARLGIPTGFCVWSWDNLSSKALLRDTPDRVFVWNDTQKDEAVRLHGIPAGHVVVTGAQCFDQWFDRQPSRSREQFCRDVGLPADEPYILYVGSTMVWKSPPEADFVVRWLRHIRSSPDAALRRAPVVIRPHPARLDEWTHVDTSGFERVGFSGVDVRADPKADYFDALFHSAAVVGINTSAFIEAGIVGRPVLAILADEFSGTQTGTIHFRYLTGIGGGVVQAGRAFDEHATQLADALAGRSRHEERQRRFLEAFVRPRGLDVPATPLFAAAVEALAARQGRRAPRLHAASRAARMALRTLVDVTRSGRARLLLLSKDEFTAAAIHGSPGKPLVRRLTRRAVKGLERVRGALRVRTRAVALGRRATAAAVAIMPGPRRAPARAAREAPPAGDRSGACLVVSYHYVRDPRQTRFDGLKGLSPIELDWQLSVLEHACDVLDPARFLDALDGGRPLQHASALLTFDDGLVDHYAAAFPLLCSRGLRGVFFVSPTHDGRRPRVLNVQKVQLLLASLGGERLHRELEGVTTRAGRIRRRDSGDPVLYRYDAPADRHVKQLLNYELPYEVADEVLTVLFERHIGPEAGVASELYLTDDMIREMSRAGMLFGFHTVRHRVLSRLGRAAQRAEVQGGVRWIRDLTGQATVPFCYPHGHRHAYTATTVDLVRRAGYSMAFTAIRALADPARARRFELPRYDTRDVDAVLAPQDRTVRLDVTPAPVSGV